MGLLLCSKLGLVLAITLCSLFLQLETVVALPLCLNQEAPFSINGSLSFCSDYSGGTGCCSQEDDSNLAAQFQSMNISSNSTCAGFVKQIVCSRCDPYATDLFQKTSLPRLCNSTTSATSNASSAGYCSDLWDACKDVSIKNSPFSPSLVDGTSPPAPSTSLSTSSSSNRTLAQEWQSEPSFCNALGVSPLGEDGATNFCFQGGQYKFPSTLNSTEEPPPPGVCFDKLAEDNYIGLVPHPDGSNRVFLATQQGQVYLAVLPEEGSRGNITVDKKTPFLDISNYVVFDREFGLMSIAFHPEFLDNGRFFVSYNCDRQKWSGCGGGRCACNADVGCDPAQIRSTDGTLPCQYSSVISEFSAGNGTVTPSRAVAANPSEVKRILTMQLPFTTHHGGLLLFGPEDKYLYFMMGDGGGSGDPFNFAQNKNSLLGKILRLDVDKSPGAQEMNGMGLWGQYGIPETNPFVQTNNSRPEIWALGLRNPWRCSFDAVKPEYFYCADVGEANYEEVNLVTKGGNYGWRVYDGPNLFTPLSSTPGGNTSAASVHAIFPVATYTRNSVNGGQGSASIIGGCVSRSIQDPCLYAKYLFADLYGGNIWGSMEVPEGSGNYTTMALNFTCSDTSPTKCGAVKGSSLPYIGYVFSWGEDNSRNVYMLTTDGVFKVVNPSKCNHKCSKRLPSSATSPPLTPLPSSPSVPTALPPSHGHTNRKALLSTMALSILSGTMLL